MRCVLGIALSVALSFALSIPAAADAPVVQTYPSLAAVPVTADSSPLTGIVYTANENSDSVSAIDLSSGTVSTIATEITPHNLQASFDGGLILVVGPKAQKNAGHSHESEHGALLIFASDHFADGPVATIEVGRHPAHVVVDAKTRLAFVTNSEDDNVTVIDIARRASIGSDRDRPFSPRPAPQSERR